MLSCLTNMEPDKDKIVYIKSNVLLAKKKWKAVASLHLHPPTLVEDSQGIYFNMRTSESAAISLELTHETENYSTCYINNLWINSHYWLLFFYLGNDIDWMNKTEGKKMVKDISKSAAA